MKKLLIVLFSFCVLQSTNAQVIRAGVLGFGAGGGSKNAGLTLHILELSYAPQPRFDVGLYSNLGLGASSDDDGVSSEVRGGLGLGVQGKFYLLTGKVKPFVGLQAGPRFGGSGTIDESGEEIDGDAGVTMQIVPQAGLRLGPLNLWGSYSNKAFQGNLGFVFGFGKFD